MFTCDVCGSTDFYTDTVSEIFDVEGRRILVENIPVQVCGQCGEMSFSGETAEKVRRLIHDETQAVGVIELELYEFA